MLAEAPADTVFLPIPGIEILISGPRTVHFPLNCLPWRFDVSVPVKSDTDLSAGFQVGASSRVPRFTQASGLANILCQRSGLDSRPLNRRRVPLTFIANLP
jgi:hypothetical protein